MKFSHVVATILVLTTGAAHCYAAPIVSGDSSSSVEPFPSPIVEFDDKDLVDAVTACRLALHEKRYADAERHARRLTTIRPKQVEGFLLLSESLERQGLRDDALQILVELVDQHRSSSKGWFALIGGLVARDRIPDAIVIAQRAQKEFPSERSFVFTEIGLLYKSQQTKQGSALLEKTLSLGELNPEELIQLAKLMQRLGHNHEAAMIAKSVLALPIARDQISEVQAIIGLK